MGAPSRRDLRRCWLPGLRPATPGPTTTPTRSTSGGAALPRWLLGTARTAAWALGWRVSSCVARDTRALAAVRGKHRRFAAGDDVQRGRLLAHPGARRLMAAAQTASDDSAPPGLPGSVPELLSRRRAEPDGEFLITDEERLSFAEADAQSRTLADALLASGVGKGTRVGILFPNCAQWLVAWLAAARIGALTVPLSTFAPGAELARLLRHTDTQVLLMGRSIAGRDLVARVADALPG